VLRAGLPRPPAALREAVLPVWQMEGEGSTVSWEVRGSAMFSSKQRTRASAVLGWCWPRREIPAGMSHANCLRKEAPRPARQRGVAIPPCPPAHAPQPQVGVWAVVKHDENARLNASHVVTPQKL